MPDLPSHQIRLASLTNRKTTRFALNPDQGTRNDLAAELGILGIRKLSFEGALSPQGKSDWVLEASLGATVQQACVISLDPVTTRIDEDVHRLFSADYEEPEGSDVEMVQDDTVDPLPAVIDVFQILRESLSLALPAFPKREDAELGEANYAGDGIAPLSDADVKPFAGLASLRESLVKKGTDDA